MLVFKVFEILRSILNSLLLTAVWFFLCDILVVATGHTVYDISFSFAVHLCFANYFCKIKPAQ